MAPGAERRSETVLGLRQMPAVPGAPMGGHVSCAGVSRASRSHTQCSLVMRARQSHLQRGFVQRVRPPQDGRPAAGREAGAQV